jgi:hypothetical protein
LSVPRGVGPQIANSIYPNESRDPRERKKTMNAEERKQNNELLDKLLGGKEHRIALQDESDAMCDRAYAAGVSDAREQARNPNHPMRFSNKANDASKPTQTKTIEQLSARAREIQDEAAKNGRTVSNIDSVRLAYAEANIPWQ